MSVSSEDDEEKYMAHLDDQEFNYPTEAAFSVELTTKRAVEYLIAGSLRDNVCRCCLAVTGPLSQLDEVLQIEGGPRQYNLSIKDLIASIYPYQITNDLYLPDKICEECIDKAVSSYRFIQQCERSERAIKNCFDHVHQSVSTIDPIERPKSRGRPKIHLNLNTLHAPFETVLEYAEPMINLVNRGAVPNEGSDGVINELECPKCWQEFSDLETLLRHGKEHAKTMWYHCKICGTAFAKHKNYLKHINSMHNSGTVLPLPLKYTQQYKCNECGALSDTYATHLQHCELHKFKEVLACVLYRQTERLCSVCFKTEREMIDLNEKMELFGGYPGLTGEHTPSSMLKHLLPTDMDGSDQLTGTRICSDCLDSVLKSFIFLLRTKHLLKRLNYCLKLMLKHFIETQERGLNMYMELSNDLIFPIGELGVFHFDLESLENEKLGQLMDLEFNKYKEEFLEDEFRKDESDNEVKENVNLEVLQDEIKNEHFPIKILNGSLPHLMNRSVALMSETDLLNIDEFTYLEDAENHLPNKIPPIYCIEFPCNTDYTSHNKSLDKFNGDKRRKSKIKAERPSKIIWCCPFCEECLVSKHFFKIHLKDHIHTKSLIKCSLCQQQFNSKYHLRQHLKLTHSNRYCNAVVCKICGRPCRTLAKLRVHEKMHYTKQCILCDKVFSTQLHFNSHIQRHLIAGRLNMRNPLQIQCCYCLKKFTSKNMYGVHINKVHTKRKLSCDICDKQFYSEQNLKHHKRVHERISIEKCALCDKVLKSKYSLNEHVRKHLDGKLLQLQSYGNTEFKIRKILVEIHHL